MSFGFNLAPRAAGVLAALIALASPALAQRNLEPRAAQAGEQRVALVIGNAAYQRGALKNPVNDARSVAEQLQRLGFVVVKRENLRTKEIGAALREFRSRLSAGATALFFYAGHGLQVKGVNYLPAVDADIEAEDDVPLQSLNVSQVLDLMEESKTRVNLVFLDACRDNPFARKFRSASRGLAKVDAASGTLISFATRPGSVAADGDGKNGLYTEYLLRHMEETGLPIEQMLKRVGAGVKLASKGRQEPWSEGLIEGDFYFRAGAQVAASASISSAPDPAAIELTFWESIKDSRSREELTAYLDSYPNGRFAGLAKARLQNLGAAEERPAAATSVASAAPAQQAPVTVYLYRKPQWFDNPDFSITSNARPVGQLSATRPVFQYEAPAGELSLGADGDGRSASRTFRVDPGKTYYVELVSGKAKKAGGGLDLRLANEGEGAEAVKQLSSAKK